MNSEIELHPLLLDSTKSLGFEKLTPVQEKVIPLVLDNKDIMVRAATGSGKTAAYALPILQRLLTQPIPNTSTLVVVPTRELAKQIATAFKELCKKTAIKIASIAGGTDFKDDEKALARKPDIVIATPGRLQKLVENKSFSYSTIQTLVFDEADRMLDMGFRENMLTIIDSSPKHKQTLLLSATLPGSIRKLGTSLLNSPELVLINRRLQDCEHIEQFVLLSDDVDHKEKQLHWLVKNQPFKKALVFANTKKVSDRLDGLLRYFDQRSAQIHGDIHQKNRQATLKNFHDGKINVLVATDVAARGLDIKGVDLVINFEMPRKGDDYIHRIGRSGRAGNAGVAITLISPPEWNLMISIERYLKTSFKRMFVKDLAGNFKGPKKVKSSGKAAAKKKKKSKK